MNRPIKKDVNYLQNLIDYAKRNIKKGYTIDSLRWALISQGHSRLEVEKALTTAQSEVSKENMAANRVRQEPALTEPTISVEPEPKESFWKRWFG